MLQLGLQELVSRLVDELGSWRRSMYSSMVTKDQEGKKATLFGWVSSIRRQGGIVFLVLNDKDGSVQITIKKNASSSGLMEKVGLLTDHSSIGVRGTVRAAEKAPGGAEVLPEEIKLLAIAKKTAPFSLHGSKLPKIDKLLDIRAVDLRRPKGRAIMRVRREVLNSTRRFFQDRGYDEVNTPKIIATATEGGAALFPLLYYDKEAFLTQSPQLYKEQLVLSFEKVFEIADAYRAEKSRTLHHLSEFISIDMEEAYVDYKDVMTTLESLLKAISSHLLSTCRGQLQFLGAEERVAIPDDPIKRIRYDDVIEMLKSQGVSLEWGDDLSSSLLDTMEKRFPSFYFITDWPSKEKPFYIKSSSNDLSESFDLMHGALELASGGTRVSGKSELQRRLKEKGLNPKGFDYHLRVFDYGMPPHAGFGMGLERLLIVLTNQQNVREVSFFPRDQFRLTP